MPIIKSSTDLRNSYNEIHVRSTITIASMGQFLEQILQPVQSCGWSKRG